EVERWISEDLTPQHQISALFWHLQTLKRGYDCEFNFNGFVVTVCDQRTAEQRVEPLTEPPLIKPKRASNAKADPQPSIETFIGFVQSKGKSEQQSRDLYEVWNDGGWRTSDAKPIDNWRMMVSYFIKWNKWPFGNGKMTPEDASARVKRRAME